MTQPSPDKPFSKAWTFASIVLFLAIELCIGTWVGPLVIGKYVSPAFHLQLQMMMHLGSFYLGGVLVGLISPGVRLQEPALAAFLSVCVVFSISFFVPGWFYPFTWGRMLVGAVIAMVLALFGAYSGEKLMGNVEADHPDAVSTARGRLRSALWSDNHGMFAGRDDSRVP